MITEYTNKDFSNILSVINNAALKYKGVIPDDCWHEPYMSEKELINELKELGGDEVILDCDNLHERVNKITKGSKNFYIKNWNYSF